MTKPSENIALAIVGLLQIKQQTTNTKCLAKIEVHLEVLRGILPGMEAVEREVVGNV